MKISRNWLQRYFSTPLPEASALGEALTFHAFEIDGLEKHQDDDILDVKVTPNRGHDCLSHLAIAKELSAILNLPLRSELTKYRFDAPQETGTYLRIGSDPMLSVKKETDACSRFMVTRVKGVKVGPSPIWLVDLLEAIGQRSINNIVDATNFAMFSIGQPLHAFDARTLASGEGYSVGPRMARAGESLTALDGKVYALSPERMVIAGGAEDSVLGIAGVKGGMHSGVSAETVEIILEAATFDGVSVRRTSRLLDLRTDASQRFEQGLSTALPPIGLRVCIELVLEIAGGEIVGTTDVRDALPQAQQVVVSTAQTNRVLGTSFTDEGVADALTRLRLVFARDGEAFAIAVPPERLDITIEEDLIEEIGRIAGYDSVPSVELSPLAVPPSVNAVFAQSERVREQLISDGFSEVITTVFAEKGDRAVLNKVGGERPFLRTTLTLGLAAALGKNSDHKELLGTDDIRIFEIGTVWKGDREIMMVGTATKKNVEEKPLSEYPSPSAYDDLPVPETRKFAPFSKYPYIVRDIALWVPSETDPVSVLDLIREHAGDLVVTSYQFDSFTKGERTSYAFRLVFQSFDRTLLDEDANARMKSVTAAVTEKGYEVR